MMPYIRAMRCRTVVAAMAVLGLAMVTGLIVRHDHGAERVYSVALKLQAGKGSGKYAAEARVEYTKLAAGWKIKQVGLLSIRKIE